MRSHFVGMALLGLLLPQVAGAQVYLLPTPDPTVTAANEQWQRTGEAIYYRGDFYYPGGATEFFDGRVMVRTGAHHDIPIYENSTLPQGTVIYVPVAGRQMKPYERRRRDGIAGTTGGRTPSFPVDPRMSDTQAASLLDDREQYTARIATDRAQWDWPKPVATAEVPALTQVPQRRAGVVPAGVITSVPKLETTNAGAYVQFDGARYYSSGRAMPNQAGRFTRVGGLNGSGVYREEKGREEKGSAKTIYVESVPGGLIAPYTQK